MTVFINPCIDGEYENPDLICSDCKKPATVKEYEIFIVNKPSIRYRICKWCLDKAIIEINRAILDRHGISPPYTELPTQELPLKQDKREKPGAM